MPTPVMVLKTKKGSFRKEVYLMPAHATFPGFGGSSRGLYTGKTPSLIIRDRDTWGLKDYEFAADDRRQWEWLAARIADGTLIPVPTLPDAE